MYMCSRLSVIITFMIFIQISNIFVALYNSQLICYFRSLNHNMPASPSKKTGINAELNVSDELAKIIGTKKGERISRPQVSLRITQHFLKLQFTVYPVCQETLGLLEGERSAGPREQTVVHPWRHDGSHLWRREDQVFSGAERTKQLKIKICH